jgi:hypothetical protein
MPAPPLPLDIRLTIDILIDAARKAERAQRTPRPADGGQVTLDRLQEARKALETAIREELK